MKELTVDLGQRAYPIHVGEGALALLGEELKRLKATRVLLVTNSTVGPLYERAALQSICRAQTDLPVAVVTLPDGECFKDFAFFPKLAYKTGRSFFVLGILGDIKGDFPQV